MDLSFFFKVLCDCSVWFIVGNYAFFSRLDNSYYLACVLISLCAALTKPLRATKYRLAPLAFFAVIVAIWARSVATAVLLIIPMVYAAIICVKKLYEPGQRESASYYKAVCIVTVIGSVALTLTKLNAPLPRCAPFMVTFMLAGLLMLRALRLDPAGRRDKWFTVWNIATMAVIGLFAIFASSGAAKASAAALLNLVRKYLIGPIFIAVSYIVGGIGWLLSKFFALFGAVKLSQSMHMDMSAIEEVAGMAGAVTGEAVPGGKVFIWLIAGVGILVGIIIVVVLIRKLFLSMGKADESIPDNNIIWHFAKQDKKPEPTGPVAQVRKHWKRFLKSLRASGFKAKPCTNSMDAVNAASEKCKSDAKALREVYIISRYDPTAQVTKDDAEMAKTLLGKCRKALEK